jgi:hypothetical protein
LSLTITIPDIPTVQTLYYKPPPISRLSDGQQLWRVLHLIAGDPPSWDTSPAASLSLVCKKWKTIVDRNPSLWSYIFIDENMTVPRLRMHFARSKTELLHIHFSHLEYDPDEDQHDPGRKERRRIFMDHIWENLPRCRHLDLGDPIITLIVLSMMPSHLRLTQLYYLSIVWPNLGQHSESVKSDRRKLMILISKLDATEIFSNLRSLKIVTEGLTLDGFSWSILLRPEQPLKRLALHIQSIEHQEEFVMMLHDVQQSLEKLTLRVEKAAGIPVDLPDLPVLRTLRFEGDVPPGWLQTFVSSAKCLQQLTLDIEQPGAICRANAGELGWDSYLPAIPTLKTLRICFAAYSTFDNAMSSESILMTFLSSWLNSLLPSLTTLTIADYRIRSRFPRQLQLKVDPILLRLARQGAWMLHIRNLNFLYLQLTPPAFEYFLRARDAAITQSGLQVAPRLYMRMTEFHGYTRDVFQMAAQRGVSVAGEY